MFIRSSTNWKQSVCQMSRSLLSGYPDILFQRILWLKCLSLKRGIIQSNVHKILIRLLHYVSNIMPDIIILAQAVL